MATFTTTPNMGMTNPTPGQEPGIKYATDISGDIDLLDAHDHTLNKGLPITPDAMNVDSDLTFQNNNATNLRSVRLAINNATLGGIGDLNCVYDVSGNLWFNNGSGTPIQITAGSVVNNSTPTTYPSFTTSGNYAINANDIYVVIAANPASNTITITLPLAASVSIGRFYIVKDATGNSQTHNITVSPAALDTIDTSVSSSLIADNFWAIGYISDGISNWYTLKYNKFVYNSGENLIFKTGSTISGAISTVSSSTFSIGGYLALSGLLSLGATLVNNSNSPYTINTSLPISPASLCFLVDTGTACTINLPPLTTGANAPQGMVIIFKDLTGTAGTNHITLHPATGDKIEQLTSDYLMQADFGSTTLISSYSTSRTWSLI